MCLTSLVYKTTQKSNFSTYMKTMRLHINIPTVCLYKNSSYVWKINLDLNYYGSKSKYKNNKHYLTPRTFCTGRCFSTILSSLLPMQYLKNTDSIIRKEGLKTSRDTMSSRRYSHSSDGLLYKFRYIRLFQMISRFKIYQIAFMSGALYPLHTLRLEEKISDVVFYSAIGGCAGTTAVFLVFSYFATKVVGQLAVESDQLLISRLSFYGRRKDDFVNLEDIVPASDFSDNNIENKMFQRFYVEQENKNAKVYLYSVKHGTVFKEDTFQRVLGLPS